MDAEQGVAAQHLDVPVLEVEGIMGGYSREVDRSLIIGGICDCKVGQAGDAD